MSEAKHHFPFTREIRSWLAACVVIAASLLAALTARADATVADCSEATLRSALTAGGNVLFVGGDCSLALGAALTIGVNTVLDAGTNRITLSASNQFRVLTVAPNVQLTMKGITITGGQNPTGGGLYIDTNAVVLLTNCTLAENSALGSNGLAGVDGADNNNGSGHDGTSGGGGTAVSGGAICNLGTLSLLNCNLTNNSATGGNGGNGGSGGDGNGTLARGGNGGNGGAGGAAWGGAIFNSGSLLLSNCTVAGNSLTGGGGGLGGTNGTGNGALGSPGSGGAGASASGAGIYSTHKFTMINCTFSGNSAQSGSSFPAGTSTSNGRGYAGQDGASGLGGGLCALDGVALTNCTFSANSVAGGNGGDGGDSVSSLARGGNGGNGGSGLGGAIYSMGETFVVNCTLANGKAAAGTNGVGGSGFATGNPGSMGAASGAGIANGGGVFTLKNTILSTNLALVAGTISSLNASGTIADAGHNLSSDSTPTTPSSTTLLNTDPQLNPLMANGGPTLTMGLTTGSPAIDAIGANPADFPSTDERGVSRPQGSGADIGAYELNTYTSTVLVSLPNAGSGIFSFTYQTLSGLAYEVQYKNALSDLNWLPILTNIGTGGALTNTDPVTNSPTRFYRVQVR